MNNTIAKKLRKILIPNDPIGRRNYRRAKKIYSRLSREAKPLFLNKISELMNSN